MQSRPNRHFAPPRYWMNDPNGLIYHKGLYHLYYQHNPVANEFGNISWGHATSKDLISWQHHKVALWHDHNLMMYSGCTVVDDDGCICAIYTEHAGAGDVYNERICLAKSWDDGYTFDLQNREVILEHRDPDFRDPKVFWYEAGHHWVMCVSLPKQYTILFYKSDNLYDWELTGQFTNDHFRGRYWECPDLFPLKDDDGSVKWVLTISGQNVDGVTWGMFYFVGDFDGRTFNASGKGESLDWGADFYAGITFEGIEERIMMGWCGNWAYAGKLNEVSWSGIMASPRRLKLVKGRVLQELISNARIQQLEVRSSYQTLSLEGVTLMWSDAFVKIDRSSSALHFPLENTVVEFNGYLQALEISSDCGIIECVINGGERIFTVRV